MPCSICAAIPAEATANTGRDEYFGEPISSLKRVFDTRDDDLRQCPECGNLFFWSEYVAFTGSGNNDDETLTRFADGLQTCVRELVGRDADTPAQLAELARHVFALPPTQRQNVLRYIHRRRDVQPQLITFYVAEAVRRKDPSIVEELHYAAKSDRAFAKQVLAAIEANPSPVLDKLATIAKLAQCSICGTYDKLSLAYDAKRFKNYTGGTEDIWECRECTSLFRATQRANGYELARQPDWHAKTLRLFMEHRAPLTTEQAESLLFYKQDDCELVVAHAITHDRALVREMVPAMIDNVIKHGKAWVVPLVEKFVAGSPEDAALVMQAIERGPKPNYSWHQPLADELTATVKAHLR